MTTKLIRVVLARLVTIIEIYPKNIPEKKLNNASFLSIYLTLYTKNYIYLIINNIF